MSKNLQEKDGLQQEDGDLDLVRVRASAKAWLEREFDDCSVHAVGKVIEDDEEEEGGKWKGRKMKNEKQF